MSTVYTYDTRNRLTKIEHKDGSTVLDGWTYSLDDQGNITRTDQADVAGGNPASGAYRDYTLDHLGSTSGLYDGAKAKVASLAYTPYGASYGDVGPGPLPRYTGHHWDGAAGLHLAPYRAYAPTLARWLSRDPLGMVDGPNVYGYVVANPIAFVDPLGLESLCYEGYSRFGCWIRGGTGDTDACGVFRCCWPLNPDCVAKAFQRYNKKVADCIKTHGSDELALGACLKLAESDLARRLEKCT